MNRSVKGHDKLFNRIVLPIDGSKKSEEAADIAFKMAKTFGLEVTVLHVIHVQSNIIPPSETTYFQDLADIEKKQGEKLLNDASKKAANMGVQTKTILRKGIPEDEIITQSKPSDLIIMGCKGHSTFERILIGGVAEKVLHHSDTNVMIVR